MSGPRNFVADLAKSREKFDAISLKEKEVNGDKAMSKSQIYKIMSIV
jgi:hypothetical protein